MKLRIRGNSIRLRLTRSEVGKFGFGESVSESLQLLPIGLVYEVRPTAEASHIYARFETGRLTVFVPARQAREWAASDAVGLEVIDGVVRILIEKDFACMKPRDREDETDMFDRPIGAADA